MNVLDAVSVPDTSLVLARDTAWISDGTTVLGMVMGLGVIIGIISILIVAGKMIQANFTGDPWIAARGMGELPWIMLGVVFLLIAGPAIHLLLGAKYDDPKVFPDDRTVWEKFLDFFSGGNSDTGGDGGNGGDNGGQDDPPPDDGGDTMLVTGHYSELDPVEPPATVRIG